MNEGYIKLWRKIMKTAFYKKSKIVHLAIHLLLKANHRPHSFIWNGKAETIGTGEVLTGLKSLKSETGQSIQNLRTGLLILSHPTIGFLTIKSTNRFSIISIIKYEEYQAESTRQLTNSQQTANKQVTTNNNDKNEKNEKEILLSANAEGSKPVNWGNCKTDLQRVIATYVRLTTPALYANCTQAQATAIFKVQGKAVGPLLAQCGDSDTACRVVEMAAKYYGSKGLDWSLHAVNKSCIDYLNQIAREKNYGASR